MNLPCILYVWFPEKNVSQELMGAFEISFQRAELVKIRKLTPKRSWLNTQRTILSILPRRPTPSIPLSPGPTARTHRKCTSALYIHDRAQHTAKPPRAI